MAEKKPRKTAKTAPETPPEGFRIVGIGASAGGLEAFEQFFRSVPADCAMAFVLVPHLDPDHASILTEILQRATSLPVTEATDRQQVLPGRVYVIPPNRDMTIAQGVLGLTTPERPHGQRMPIDGFFRSLGADQQHAAAGIVLSGTGSDGTRGLRAIRDAGGVTLAQDPSTARYDGMPASAITAGVATAVLAPQDMPAALLKLTQPHPASDPVAQLAEPEIPAALANGAEVNRILSLMRSATGHDFSQYKKNTVMRRIVRRMAAHDTEDAEHYARILRHDHGEVEALFAELLINVTGFFRDPEAFAALKDNVLRPYLAERPNDFVFRAWVAGCASGEEAYSIAILLSELMKESQRPFTVQLYATDLDAAAIETARAASYPHAVAADITPERLQRCFVKSDTRYQVKKSIREMVVFALQDVIKDPPFTRLDLLSCRNVMIYLETPLQSRLMRTFHYALKTGGVLFLSPSEHVGEHTALFAALDRKWKIYRATQASPAPRAFATDGLPWAALAGDIVFKRDVPAEKTRDLAGMTRDMLLRTFAPASVLVDAKGDILYVHGDTEKYLRPAPGHATLNVVSMARPPLQLALFSALQATREPAARTTRETPFPDAGSPQRVGITVQALPKQDNGEHFLLISFQDIEAVAEIPARAPPPHGKPEGASADAERIRSLERDLAYTHEKLQTIIEEQQASNEELKATNEEMQSTNEELQSTNEEMETSKEELHSVNEELMSVNAELQSKIQQMDGLQNDLKNLLDNVGMGVVFLDDLLCIRRYTAEAKRIFRLVDSDVGRPLADIKSGIAGDDPDALLRRAQVVLDTLSPYDGELRLLDDGAFLVRIQPYRTVDNLIDGVVLTFTDISARVAAEEREQAARRLADSIVDTVRDPLLVLDATFHVISASRAFYRFFGASPKDTIGRTIDQLDERQWDIPALRDLLDKVLPHNDSFDDYVVETDVAGLGRRKLTLSGRKIIGDTRENGAKPLILLTIDTGTASDDAR